MAKEKYSPVLYEYLRRYQENPGSRLFAPLAEAYRKAGLLDEAVEICREGLAQHPAFIGGRVALARALFDQQNFEEVVQELQSVVLDAPDNLVAQRLMAESCLLLGRMAEALGAYKMLLYYSPSDAEIAKLVQELEVQAYESGALVLRNDPATPAMQGFDVRPAGEAINEAPETRRLRWVKKIETLQALLLKVERYRLTRFGAPG